MEKFRKLMDKWNPPREPSAWESTPEYKRKTEKIHQLLEKTKQYNIDPLHTFNWLDKQRDKQLKFLCEQLIKQGFIASDTTSDLFIRAFSNMKILNPLKIKWIVKGKNDLFSKSLLFHFFELLVVFDKIEKHSTSVLYKKLEWIFVDGNGNPFKNFKQSNFQKSKRRLNKGDKLEEIIKSLPK